MVLSPISHPLLSHLLPLLSHFTPLLFHLPPLLKQETISKGVGDGENGGERKGSGIWEKGREIRNESGIKRSLRWDKRELDI